MDEEHIGFNDHARPEPFEDFPHGEIFDRLDGTTHIESNWTATAYALRKLFIYMVGPIGENSFEKIGTRTAAIAYALDPGLFRGTPSLRRVRKRITALKRASQRKT